MLSIYKMIKNQIIRNKVKFKHTTPAGLSFKIAETQAEYLEAAKILYQCYIEKGFTKENRTEIRMTPYHLLPTTTVILALWDNVIIGTVSLIRDNPLGLPLEKIFDLTELRQGQNIICEVSSLAIKKEYRGKSGEMFFPLVRFLWNYSRKYLVADYLVIAINPMMAQLYEALFNYKSLAKAKADKDKYEFANNNPVRGQFVSVKTAYDEVVRSFWSKSYFRRLLEYMKSGEEELSRQVQKKYFTHNSAPIGQDWYLEFQKFVPELQENHTLNDLISKSLGYKSFEMMLMAKRDRHLRVSTSFEVTNFNSLEIVDASPHGVRIKSSSPVAFGHDAIILKCKISETELAQIIVRPVWVQNDKFIGCKILKSSSNWLDMINESLNKQQEISYANIL